MVDVTVDVGETTAEVDVTITPAAGVIVESGGAKGDPGEPGPQGIPGVDGVDGAVGAQGPAGPTGPAGASITGPTGPTGATGSQGNAGAISSVAVTQIPYDAYPGAENTGTPQNASLMFYIPQGAPGATGATGATGPAGPSNLKVQSTNPGLAVPGIWVDTSGGNISLWVENGL